MTLDGEILEPTGVLTGGVAEGPGSGALTKKREIAELESTVQGLEGEVAGAQERSSRIHARIAAVEAALAALQADTHEKDIRLVEGEKDLARAADELQRARESADAASLEMEQHARTLEELLSEHREAEGESVQAEADRAARKSAAETLEAASREKEQAAAKLASRATELRVKVAQDAERREATSRQLSKAAEREAEIASQLARLQAEAIAAESRLRGVRAEIDATQADSDRLGQELAESQAGLERGRAAHEERTHKVASDEEQARADRAKLSEVGEQAGQAAMREREVTLSIENLCANLREKYQVELPDELSRFHTEKPSGALEQERLAGLRERIERMGEVNLTAVEEYEEVKKRFEFLGAQKADLEASIAKLRAAIAKVNRTSRERFTEAFEIVNAKFQQVFPRLFNGGKAELVLCEGPDLMEAGVDIVAQPPGKKLQNINLLSGGEKALTAVALIFAIFLVKPSPFCLLDEVDAPLDDSNVDRYNALVMEMARQSQFIVITHNKRTMQIADTLYGVTMEEPGVSRLVSVRLRDEQERAAG